MKINAYPPISFLKWDFNVPLGHKELQSSKSFTSLYFEFFKLFLKKLMKIVTLKKKKKTILLHMLFHVSILLLENREAKERKKEKKNFQKILFLLSL